MASNPFDKIAKPKTKESKSTKITATVNDDIKSIVDIIIKKKAAIKQIDAEKKIYEEEVIDHVSIQQDEQAYKGNFSKSFSVSGINGILTYTTCDSFTLPEDEPTLKELKNLLEEKFDEFFENKRTIILKEEVQKNTPLINKIVKAITAAGMELNEAFEVTDKLCAKPDLDLKQYELPKIKLEKFRTLVKQKKACLK